MKPMLKSLKYWPEFRNTFKKNDFKQKETETKMIISSQVHPEYKLFSNGRYIAVLKDFILHQDQYDNGYRKLFV